MQRVVTTLVDDTDGSEAAETVRFAMYGASYEIDLAGYVSKARKVGGRTRPAGTTGSSSLIGNQRVRKRGR